MNMIKIKTHYIIYNPIKNIYQYNDNIKYDSYIDIYYQRSRD
jgi:hypothetical protein